MVESRSAPPQVQVTQTCLFPQGCFVFSLVKYKPLTYNKVYEYPDWAIGVGWCLALASMVCIPLVMVIKILQSEGPLIEVRVRGQEWDPGRIDMLSSGGRQITAEKSENSEKRKVESLKDLIQ